MKDKNKAKVIITVRNLSWRNKIRAIDTGFFGNRDQARDNQIEMLRLKINELVEAINSIRESDDK